MKEELVKKLTLAGVGTVTTIGTGFTLHMIMKKIYPHSKDLSSEKLADMVEAEEDPGVILKELAALLSIELGITMASVAAALIVQKLIEGALWPEVS